MFNRVRPRGDGGSTETTDYQETTTIPPMHSSSASLPAPAMARQSVVAADLKVVGDLTSESDIQVDGVVEGNINAKTLVVGEGGTVNGEISGQTIRILGKVVGPVRGHTVTLAKTAHVTGEIRHEVLTIDAGAFIDGHCKRLESSEAGTERMALVNR